MYIYLCTRFIHVPSVARIEGKIRVIRSLFEDSTILSRHLVENPIPELRRHIVFHFMRNPDREIQLVRIALRLIDRIYEYIRLISREDVLHKVRDRFEIRGAGIEVGSSRAFCNTPTIAKEEKRGGQEEKRKKRRKDVGPWERRKNRRFFYRSKLDLDSNRNFLFEQHPQERIEPRIVRFMQKRL